MAEFPTCPECGAEWEPDDGAGEEGPVEDGILYTTHAVCGADEDHIMGYGMHVDRQGAVRSSQELGDY